MIYRGRSFEVFPGVYEPCDDSFMLAEALTVRKGYRVLDMGTGCGIQGILAAAEGGRVTACDISEKAVECARYNAARNKVDLDVVKSDLFQEVEGAFDLVVFNPPYLPSEPLERGDEFSGAWDGGVNGGQIIENFIREVKGHLAPKGRVQLVASTLTGIDGVMGSLAKAGMRAQATSRKRFFFEELVLIVAVQQGRFSTELEK